MTARTPVDGTWEPRPATRWEDAFLGGNGRHGAMVYGDPADDRVIVNHHTLVRPNGSGQLRPPELADRLHRLQSALLAGDTTAAERFGDGRPLAWVQPFHPAFQTRIRPTPDASPASDGTEPPPGYRRSVDFATGEITAVCEAGCSQVFVSRADDVIVQYVTGPGLAVDLALDHALPGAPANLAIGRSTVLTPDGGRIDPARGLPGQRRRLHRDHRGPGGRRQGVRLRRGHPDRGRPQPAAAHPGATPHGQPGPHGRVRRPARRRVPVPARPAPRPAPTRFRACFPDTGRRSG